MSASLSLTETAVFTAVRGALLTFGLVAANPAVAVPILRGQVNRVPEPTQADFLMLWPLMRDRLATNIDTVTDTIIVGSITANVLTVTSITQGGPIEATPAIYGDDVAAGCRIVAQLTGPTGGVGSYAVTTTPDIASDTLYLGTNAILQKIEMTIQCDVHGPASGDNAQRISTLWRDQFGFEALKTQSLALSPLYTADPRQMPFTNGEQQWEDRWVVDLCLEAGMTVTVTQQFADELEAATIPVDVIFVP